MPRQANPTTPTAVEPRGYLTFKATRAQDLSRELFIGLMPVFNLIDQHFIAPVASEGLSPEILELSQRRNGTGPVQRKTNAAHVQGIVDYIVEQAEAAQPWAFNAIVLYSTDKIDFETESVGVAGAAGEARAYKAFSVGEGLHRSLAWAVALGLAKVRGVKRPEMSAAAAKRIELATIPVIIIVEPDLHRQKIDFHMLNQQKALTSTVLALTDETALSDLTRGVIDDVKLFDQRIDINNASVGAKSDKLMSFAQLRFAVASYLLGRKTRSPKINEREVEKIVQTRGRTKVRAELKEAFTEIASRFGGLERLHLDRTHGPEMGEHVRKLRAETLLTGSSTWRSLLVALHDAKEHGVDVETAMDRIKKSGISWQRDSEFFAGSLLEVDPDTHKLTGKRLHSRESIDNAAAKLEAVMTAG
jgi:DGQHR domain-containing protein